MGSMLFCSIPPCRDTSHSLCQFAPARATSCHHLLAVSWPSCQSFRLLPCLPFQNGQKGQSSPCGKSSPSSCGQPMLPWLIATDLTPCWRKKSFISCCTFGFVVTSVATQRFRIGSSPSWRITPAAIFVVVLSSGPYVATVPMGYCGGDFFRPFISYTFANGYAPPCFSRTTSFLVLSTMAKSSARSACGTW